MALDSRTKQTIERDINYFREQQKIPSDKRDQSIWGVPSTFAEVKGALKDPKTSPDERRLLESWVVEFTLIKDRITDDTARKNLEELMKEIRPSPSQAPATIEDRTSPTNTQDIIFADGRTYKEKEQDLKNTLDTITPEKLENALGWTASILRYAPTDKKNLAEGIVGSMMIRRLGELGYDVRLRADTSVTIISPQPNAIDIENKLNTALKSGILGVDVIRSGLLYINPSFQTYATSVSLNGTIPTSQKPEDYKKYLDAKMKEPGYKLSGSESAFLSSLGAYQGYDMNKSISQVKDLEKVTGFIQANPVLATQIERVMTSPTSESPNNNRATPVAPQNAPVSPSGGPVTSAVGGTVGTVAGHIGGFLGKSAAESFSLLGQTFREAEKAGGGMGVIAVIALIGTSIWKFGFLETLGGLFVLGAVSAGYNMSQDGTFDKAKAAAKEAADKVGKKLKGTTSKDPDKPESGGAKSEDKPATKMEQGNISPSQKLATSRVENDIDLKKTFERATPGQAEYINFIHKELSGINLDKLITDDETSIFAPGAKLDPAITEKLGALTPNTLKKVLRVYLGSSARFADTKEGTTPGNKEKSALIAALEKGNIKKESFGKTSLKDAISSIYRDAQTSQEGKDTSTEMMKKIASYSINYQGTTLSKDNLHVEISEYEEGGYQLALAIKDPKKVAPQASSIDPIIVDFDKDGKLETTELNISGHTEFFGNKIPGPPQKCILKQEGNTIIVSQK